MKNIFILFSLLVFIAVSPMTYSQTTRVMVVRSYPTFTLQGNFNYNQTYLEFNGTLNNDFHSDDFIKGANLGVDKGLGGSIISKIALSGRGRLRLDVSLSYNNFKTYLFGNNSLISDIGKSSVNMFSFGLGIEHNFTPNYKYKIYLGAEGTANLINGKGTIWVPVGGTQGYTYDVTIQNSYRIGAAIFGGAEYMLNEKMGLNLGFKYHWANILLRNANASADQYSFTLRDTNNPTMLYAGNKTLAFITLMIGVNYYWGITSSRYIIK